MEIDSEITEPSEAELREMLEARDREKELQRKHLSGRFSVILLVIVLLIAAAIYLMPDRKVKPGAAAKAATSQLPPHIGGPVPDELKPFSIKPEHNADRDNVRFAAELLKFMQPGGGEPAPTTPPTKKP